MNVTELLTIDTEAELRKLAEATLEGPWQAPAELVRRALSAGARRVEVELGRGRLVVRDDGPPLSAVRQAALAVLLDPQRPPRERHDALLALEAEPELLAIAALRPHRVDVATGAGTTFTIEGVKIDGAAARRWLRTCARFAQGEVWLDGAAVPRGFETILAEAPLEAPLRGRLALTGDPTAHLWLLGAGIVSSHLTLPDTPAFEASVEIATAVRPRAPAVLREAVEPHLGALVDQAVRLTLATATRDDLSDEARRFLRRQLLIAARRGWRRAEIFRTPLLPALERPETHHATRLSLVDLGGGRPLSYLDPGDDPCDFRLPSAPVLVLDADERGALAQLLGVRFRPAERRQAAPSWRDRLGRRIRATGRALRETARRVRHPWLGAVVADAALSVDERGFLRALRAAQGEGTAALRLTDGAGPVRRGPDGWYLPRRHPDVAAAVRAVARDGAWAYVALLGLIDGAEIAAPGREAWPRRASL